jgi:hypothetical protein
MGRILLFAAVAVVGIFLLGAVLGLLFNLLKWAVIIGLIALAVAGVLKLTRGGSRSHSDPY